MPSAARNRKKKKQKVSHHCMLGLLALIETVMVDPATLVTKAIEARKTKFADLSKYLWEHPELALKEVMAHDYITNYLESEGFSVQRSYLLDTAFRAEYNTGSGPTGRSAVHSSREMKIERKQYLLSLFKMP